MHFDSALRLCMRGLWATSTHAGMQACTDGCTAHFMLRFWCGLGWACVLWRGEGGSGMWHSRLAHAVYPLASFKPELLTQEGLKAPAPGSPSPRPGPRRTPPLFSHACARFPFRLTHSLLPLTRNLTLTFCSPHSLPSLTPSTTTTQVTAPAAPSLTVALPCTR